MDYLVISRKYRPQRFDEVVGQEHICKMLQNALRLGRVTHAYLFTGSRGVGKTSTARIFAKALNCTNLQDFNPCNQCTNCQEITLGRSLDVIEIDGASNRGIEEIRDLRENVKYPPASGKYRIYIIDEVHMLTTPAFNALLKTLEEPPPHAIFIMATTEPLKVPLTIVSRCQRYDFHRIPAPLIAEALKKIVLAEKLNISDDVLLMIAKKADGALRDAETMLEQIVAFSPEGAENLDISVLQKVLGIIDYEYHFKITELVLKRDLNALLEIAREIFDSGIDISEFFTGLVEHWRNLLTARMVSNVELLDVPPTYRKRYLDEAQRWSINDLLRIIKLLNDAQLSLRTALNLRVHLEFTLLRLGVMDKTVEIQHLLELLNAIPARPMTANVEKAVPMELFGSSTAAQTKPSSIGVSTPQSTATQIPITKDQDYSYKSNSGAEKSEKRETELKVEKELKDSASTGFSFEKIIQDWEMIIMEVEETNKTLADFLRLGKPINLRNNILEIGFTIECDYHRQNVASRGKIIEEVLKNIYNQPIKIRCIQVKSTGEEEKKLKPIDELTAAAKDIFNGDILIR